MYYYDNKEKKKIKEGKHAVFTSTKVCSEKSVQP